MSAEGLEYFVKVRFCLVFLMLSKSGLCKEGERKNYDTKMVAKVGRRCIICSVLIVA